MSANGTITYDYFLSLAATHQLESQFVRKVMYFLWAYRDERIRRFICERIADQHGRWRITRLLEKANSDFFETWLQPSTARKARSNFEYFLIETNIYDPKSRTIHLELDDGWLAHAAIAAAQHENDPTMREELLANPIKFLERRNWLGLLNVTRANLPEPVPLLLTDAVPLEDIAIDTKPVVSLSGNEWHARSLTSSGRKNAIAEIDLVARERASRSHYMLEELIVELAKAQKLSPRYNQNIDIFFKTPSGAVLVEIKSCTDNNFHSQLRKGVSQLFEYRFLYGSLLGPNVAMLLLMECAPPSSKRWLVDYVRSLGIILAWKEPHERMIATRGPLPEPLSKLLKVH